MPKSKPKSVVPVVSTVSTVPKKKKPKSKKQNRSLSSFPPYLRLAVDPWNSPPEGAGRPDNNAEPTIPWMEKWAQTFTTNAEGNLMVSFRPNLPNAVFTHTLSNAADPLVTGATDYPLPNKTTLTSTFTNYRPLAIGVEFEYIGEDQLAKGVIGGARINAVPANTDAVSMIVDEPSYREGSTRDKIALRAIATSEDFLATNVQHNVPCLVVVASGLPASSACLRARFVAHFEFQVSHTALMSRDVTHTVSHPGQLATVASIVGSRTNVAVGKDPVKDLVQHAEKVAVVAGAINGMWQNAKPIVALLADFAALI